MKKYLISILIVIVIVIVIVFIVVAYKGTEAPAQSNEVLMTSAVGSMVASFFGTQTAMYTPPSPTSTTTKISLPSPTVIHRTATFAPTPTPTYVYYSATPTRGTITPTGTLPTPTVNSSALAVGCNNLAFIRDVNIPAGTVFEKNQVFTKTWKIQNTGTCNWNSLYALVSAGGDKLGGEATRINPVLVGNWSEVSVELQAPKTPGTYTSYWRVSNGQHIPFGASLAVTIVVQDVAPTAVPPTATLSPTSVPTATPTPTSIPPTETPTQTPTPTPTL
jgi:hypothetical protein